MTRALHIALFVLMLVATLTVAGQLLSRLERTNAALHVERSRIDKPNETIADLRRQVLTLAAVHDFSGEVELCRQRTESLRGVLEVLLLDGGNRRKMPDPPPGWPRWKTPAELDRLDRLKGETER
jgi:hypothetical protein